jgi:ABC-2 type transport system permease protein
MISLLFKEIRSFFSSATGYLVVGVFLLLNGSLLFVFPGGFNILEGGYAGLDNLFLLAPWVFMFLIPAVTMRLFSEEKRTGTLELLLTQPLSDIQIILAKYSAGILLVVLSLIPTLTYLATVYALGNPVGNLDLAGALGSYFGLLLLASAYVSMGILASSLTDNPVVSFVLAVVLCLLFYVGIDQLAGFFSGGFELFLLQLGINEHYVSLSRGVIDVRDVLYFLSLNAVMILSTRLVLQSRNW